MTKSQFASTQYHEIDCKVQGSPKAYGIKVIKMVTLNTFQTYSRVVECSGLCELKANTNLVVQLEERFEDV